MSAATEIRVRIDVLVVDGLPVAGRGSFAEKLQAELSQLVAERGVPALLQRGGTHERLTTSSVVASPAGLPAHRLAGAIFEGLSERDVR